MQGRQPKTTTQHVGTAVKYAAPSAGVAVLLTNVILNRIDYLFQTDDEKQLAGLFIMAVIGVATNIAMVIWKRKIAPLMK